MTENLINRISFYLASGGLFNPELADHIAVRTLLFECREALAQPDKNEFNPDYNTEAVLVEEMQRMAKRIEELEAMQERQTARIVDLQTHIANLEGEA